MRNVHVVLLAVLGLLMGFSSVFAGESRERISLEDWQFCQDTSPEGSGLVIPKDAQWAELSIPHVFRFSGLNEKSAGWYRTTLKADEVEENKSLFLFLEGAGSVADVFVNGQHIGQHKGAFTAAAFDLTPAIKPGQDNHLVIRVTNRDTEAANCLSQSNLFYTNGGLYRPVWLIKTGTVHIYPDMGSSGVYLTPKNITKDRADLEVKAYIQNRTEGPANVTLQHTVTGPDGEPCATFSTTATVAAGAIEPVTATQAITAPKLWDISQPNLYSVRTEVLVNSKVVDTLTERTGFRTVKIVDGRFMLNGKELLARGVCKHHQTEHHWNATADEDLAKEWEGILDLGANTVRLAHYPHRRFEYNIADESGIAIWAENGLAIHKSLKREMEPTADGERITREMVRQNWNHPSIIFWSSGNETYQEVASHYADVIRQEDDTRLITYASNDGTPGKLDFVAHNTYHGWYHSHYTDFKQGNAYVSETGSGAWITHHIPYGTIQWDVDHFEPEEYTELFAEFRFQTIFRNNPSAHKMFLWWNFREFYDWKFKNNRNTKGMLTLGGMPKDYYYLYRSFLRQDDPVVHLCGRHHFYRQFAPDNGIKAYSNADQVELFINGVSQGIKKNGEYAQPDSTYEDALIKGEVINNVFFWKAPLSPGKNVVEVRDNQGQSDTMVIYQKAPEGQITLPGDSLVADLKSTNENNPAIFIDRAIEAQNPFYSEVDGSSDNTFDVLPEVVEGARWIATKRLSDENNKTDLSFRAEKPQTVYVMYATGTFPTHTLELPGEAMMKEALALKQGLEENGFANTGITSTWRRHSLWLGDCGLMSRTVQAGEEVVIPGQTLDYVVLIQSN